MKINHRPKYAKGFAIVPLLVAIALLASVAVTPWSHKHLSLGQPEQPTPTSAESLQGD